MRIKARFKRMMNKRFSIEFAIRKDIERCINKAFLDAKDDTVTKYFMIPARQFKRMKDQKL